MNVVLKQGAEARLLLGEYNGTSCLVKERFVKKYRHAELDSQITRQRMKAESKTAARLLAAGLLAPKILHVDLNERRIYMEYFGSAITAKEFIMRTVAELDSEQAERRLSGFCTRLGDIVGRMHAANIIHGDLTTSNVLIDEKSEGDGDYDVVLIDFGLSHYNQGVEDKGVDLYVLERALLSTHSQQPTLFEQIMASYRQSCGKDVQAVESKFEEVRARGRKRTMIG